MGWIRRYRHQNHAARAIIAAAATRTALQITKAVAAGGALVLASHAARRWPRAASLLRATFREQIESEPPRIRALTGRPDPWPVPRIQIYWSFGRSFRGGRCGARRIPEELSRATSLELVARLRL